MLPRNLVLWSVLLIVLLASCRTAGTAAARVDPAHRDPLPESSNRERVRLVFLGDTGDRNEAMEAVRPAVRAEKADVVVVLGDLVYPVGPSCPEGKVTPEAREVLDNLVGGLLRDLGETVFLVLGNHDVGHVRRDRAREACLIDYAASEPTLWLPDLAYGVDLGVVNLMVVNTNDLDGDQAKRTRTRWAGARGWKILAGHHVLKTYHDKETEDYIRPWLKRHRLKPDLYANGHAHVLQFGVYGGLPALTSGATARLRDYPACPPDCGANQTWGASTVGYAVVDATLDALQVVFKDASGQELYKWDLRRSGAGSRTKGAARPEIEGGAK